MALNQEQSGKRGVWARVFGEGEDPSRWGLAIWKSRGFTIKLHVLFLAYAVLEMVRSVTFSSSGPGFAATMLGALLVCAVGHELGRALLHRSFGFSTDEMLIWPLGGFSGATPAENERQALADGLGGIAANLILLPVLALALRAVGVGWGGIVFNPFESSAVLAVDVSTVSGSWLLTFLWSIHLANVIVLAANVLLPLPPLAAARIAEALLLRGNNPSLVTRRRLRIGFATAALLAVAAVVFEAFVLLGVAALGAWVTWVQKDAEAFIEEPGAARWNLEAEAQARRLAKAAGDRARSREESLEIDRLLDKISRSGMESLSRAERRTLEHASSSRQGS